MTNHNHLLVHTIRWVCLVALHGLPCVNPQSKVFLQKLSLRADSYSGGGETKCLTHINYVIMSRTRRWAMPLDFQTICITLAHNFSFVLGSLIGENSNPTTSFSTRIRWPIKVQRPLTVYNHVKHSTRQNLEKCLQKFSSYSTELQCSTLLVVSMQLNVESGNTEGHTNKSINLYFSLWRPLTPMKI